MRAARLGVRSASLLTLTDASVYAGPMELREGARERPGAEPRDVAWTVRLKQSTATAIEAMATREQRRRADMLRLLIQDGYEVRAQR